MFFSQAYQEREEKIRQQGFEQGRLQGRCLAVENLLKVRFGELDPKLTKIIPSLLALPAEEYVILLLGSREELLAYFNQ